MKAEVTARGLIIDDKEVEVGKVIDVSKTLFERSTKLVKPGSTKRQVSAEEKVLDARIKACNKREATLDERDATFAEIKEAFDKREAELVQRENALKEK